MTDKQITTIEAQPMTADEAAAWKDKVQNHVSGLRLLVWEGHQREAWKALGYASWNACVEALAAEFEVSDRHLKRLHSANQIGQVVTPGSPLKIPERWARELNRLGVENEAQIKTAYQQAIDTAPDGNITAAHVQSIVDAMLPKTQSARDAHQPELDALAEQVNAARAAEREARENSATDVQQKTQATVEALAAYAAEKRRVNAVAATYAQAESSTAPDLDRVAEAVRDSTEPDHDKAATSAAPVMPDFDTLTREPDEGEYQTVQIEQHQAGAAHRLERCATSWKNADRYMALLEWRNAAQAEKSWWELQTADYQYIHLLAMVKSLPFLLEIFAASNIAAMEPVQRAMLTGVLAGFRQELDTQIERLQPEAEAAKT